MNHGMSLGSQYNRHSTVRNLALLLCATALLCSRSFSEPFVILKVRVMSARSGKPLQNASVFLSRDQSYPKTNSAAPPALAAKTDSNGWASFELEQPLPAKLFVAVPGGDRLCSDYAYDSKELIEHGVVGKSADCNGKANNGIAAVPGELVLFVKPYTLWELFKREF